MTTVAAVQPAERLVVGAARLMAGRSTVFIGTGLPMLAAALARRTCAPELVRVFEFGGIGSPLERLPLGVGESRTFQGGIDWLRECGVQVVDLASPECPDLLAGFISRHPEVWNEDIGD